MSIAPLPTPLEHLGGRRFSFYPPIRNLQPNEWLYRRVTWSECVVMNARSGEEVWIPRVFLGDVSGIDEPVMVVSLNRELEWRSGSIIPHERRVIELPAPVNDVLKESRPSSARSAHLAPVINIRLEPAPEVRARKWLGVAVVLGAVACTIVANIAWQSQARQRAELFRNYRPWLQLSAEDDYASTIRKLGVPTVVHTDTTHGSDSESRVFESLAYSARHYSVILMGSTRGNARYIGTLDPHGRVLDAVRLADGETSERVLHSLPSF
jgi:hypothetical protein